MEKYVHPYSIDILVHTSSTNTLPIVIEFDGPSHFLDNVPEELVGKMMFKRNWFKSKIGTEFSKVIFIPYFEWNQMNKSDIISRERYLRRKLFKKT